MISTECSLSCNQMFYWAATAAIEFAPVAHDVKTHAEPQRIFL